MPDPAKPKDLSVAFSDLMAQTIKLALSLENMPIPEHTQNGTYAAHQLLVSLPGIEGRHRIIIAPMSAPIALGGCPADEHFIAPTRTPGAPA